MYDFIKIVAANGVDQIFVNDDEFYPVEVFTWTPSMVGDDRAKLAGYGRHWNYKDIETQSIRMEGHIKANTTELYWTARDALLNIVIPDPIQLAPFHGYVMFKRNGDSETYYQRVHLEDSEVPTEALYPTVTPFEFEWSGIDGYWLRLSNNQPAKI